MKEFKWTENLSVGIFHIDIQHQKLMEIMNRLNGVESCELAEPLVQDVIRYAQFHFFEEEKLLERESYPHLMEHKKDHVKFLDKAIHFCEKSKNAKKIGLQEMQNFFEEWIVEHISHSDQKYSQFILKHMV